MKNKLFKATLAAVLCATLVAPTISFPVFASEDGKEIIFEDEEPFVTALWGKYSKFSGKLVYRVAGVKDVDFYTENVEEVKGYGFEISGEYVNERGERYFKFRYTGNENNTDNTDNENNVETAVASDIVEEIPTETVVVADVTEEIPAETVVVIDSAVASDIVEEISTETVVASDIVEEIPAETVVASDYSEVSLLSEDGKEIIWEDEEEVKIDKPLEGTENCTVGHCADGKEIIWEEVWTIEKPESGNMSDVVWEK